MQNRTEQSRAEQSNRRTEQRINEETTLEEPIMSKSGAIAWMLFIAAAIFVIGFGILLWKDYTVHYPYGSAPFYVYVIERAVELLVPAALCLAAGITVKRRAEKK